MIFLSYRETRHAISTAVMLLLAVAMVSGSEVEKTSHVRRKRNILQLCQLISAHTNRSCLDYNNYGCYCGLGNADSLPLDDVDNCCRAHDECYGNVDDFWCYLYFVGYGFECNSTTCVCTDSPVVSSCAYSTCRCDIQLAQCLGRSQFNYRYTNYSRKRCRNPTSL